MFIRFMVFIVGAAHTDFAKAAHMGQTPDVRFSLDRNIILFGYHIHHFYIGIALICIAGWMAIVGSSLLKKKQIAFLYGVGIGLFMDEIGLLLTWGDYFSSLSYSLSLLLAGIFLNVVFFHNFWDEFTDNLSSIGPRSRMWSAFSRNTTVKRVAGFISRKTGKAEKTSLFFAGILSISMGVLVLLYPFLLRSWVTLIFVIQGSAHLVRAWEGKKFKGDIEMKFYEKASLFFSGLVYIGVGALILVFPRLLYYGVAAVFLVHGVSSLVRAWERKEKKAAGELKTA